MAHVFLWQDVAALIHGLNSFFSFFFAQAIEQFRELSTAFQTLDDPYRRKLYDAHGDNGMP